MIANELIPGPDELPHFRYRDWVGSGSEILTDCHLYYAEQRETGFVVYHPVSLLQKYAQKSAKIIGMTIVVNRE